MPQIKNKELRLMPDKEIRKKLDELTIELMKLNAQVATGTTPKSPGQVTVTKKTIARILTILNERKKDTMKNKEETKKHE